MNGINYNSAMSQFEIIMNYNYSENIPLINVLSDYGVVVITLTSIFYLFVYFFFIKKKYRNRLTIRLIATNIHNVYSTLKYELQNISVTQAGLVGMWWLPYLIGVFSYILIANLLGLLPLQFAITSHIVIPFHLAVAFNAYLLFIGPVNLGFTFIKNFIPTGIPFILVPFVSFIELISYAIRTISLTLRLCANIMAGHVLLSILIGFAVLFYTLDLPLVFGTNLFITFLVIILETLISAIQAYVFAVLLAVYISDSVQAKH
jgi:F-type H+-transporting ATPase subunit a